MAFNSKAGSSSKAFQTPPFSQYGSPSRSGPAQNNPEFELFEWYPVFQDCLKYFLDYAQHTEPVQTLAAFMNIQLPYQKQPFPVMSSNSPSPRSELPHLRPNPFIQNPKPPPVSLIPYIRRLIVTGNDAPGILHGFFGDRWHTGIGQLHEIERRNYLFASKSADWLKVKQHYDMGPEETVPYLSPLRDASEQELARADEKWSEWLEMQDWMLGPRSPDDPPKTPRVKKEFRE